MLFQPCGAKVDRRVRREGHRRTAGNNVPCRSSAGGASAQEPWIFRQRYSQIGWRHRPPPVPQAMPELPPHLRPIFGGNSCRTLPPMANMRGRKSLLRLGRLAARSHNLPSWSRPGSMYSASTWPMPISTTMPETVRPSAGRQHEVGRPDRAAGRFGGAENSRGRNSRRPNGLPRRCRHPFRARVFDPSRQRVDLHLCPLGRRAFRRRSRDARRRHDFARGGRKADQFNPMPRRATGPAPQPAGARTCPA